MKMLGLFAFRPVCSTRPPCRRSPPLGELVKGMENFAARPRARRRGSGRLTDSSLFKVDVATSPSKVIFQNRRWISSLSRLARGGAGSLLIFAWIADIASSTFFPRNSMIVG